jgi:hypothetical protein
MNDEDDLGEVPEGAAFFPDIPAELGIDPLLLGVIHAAVFLAASEEAVVHPDAAEEALTQIASYTRRIGGERAKRIREDMACLATFARREKWDKRLIQSLKALTEVLGLGEETEEDEDDGE